MPFRRNRQRAIAVATHGGAAATSSLSPQTFLSALVAKFDGTAWKLFGAVISASCCEPSLWGGGRWVHSAFGAPNCRNDRLGACTSVERCSTEKSDDDPHDEIAHLEAHIEEPADKIESCRKFCSGTCSEGATRVGRWKRARALAVCIWRGRW